MKTISSMLAVCIIGLSGSALSAEWAHKKDTFDQRGQVTLKDAAGNTWGQNNDEAYRGLSSTSSPTVLNVTVNIGEVTIPAAKEEEVTFSSPASDSNTLRANLSESFISNKTLIEIVSMSGGAQSDWCDKPYNSPDYTVNGILARLDVSGGYSGGNTTGVVSTAGGGVRRCHTNAGSINVTAKVIEVESGTVQRYQWTIGAGTTQTFNVTGSTDQSKMVAHASNGVRCQWSAHPYNSPTSYSVYVVNDMSFDGSTGEATFTTNSAYGGYNCSSAVIVAYIWTP
ncbi:hypothetical protein PULV_a4032 [Pseudoalteromonas ulvae UL12]|uniref:hypothetical protein n=1 Tax=Pseudoalteromonas ulvae TaxID=107327 RepID=UPI00186BAE0E|nr:hypothetical protein [Pseudoalteromonas ulvae]MBE0362218.1 hypothetical protein [Pseudoalteromonas ulvae UL12]